MLNDQGRSVHGSRILVLGVSYKADVGDVRESPALLTMLLLYRRGADVRYHDFYVDQVKKARVVFDTRNAYGADRRPNVIPL